MLFVFFKQKTAYEMRISDWSSAVCSSDLEPGEVVLGLAGDLLEQLGAAAVVEVLRRQALGRLRQAGEHVAEDVVGGGMQVGQLGNGIHSESLARRRPENCQRAVGGKKLRLLARTWPAGVAQLPPRSTFCPLMNLPLYSPSEPGSGRKPGYAVSADDVHCHTSPHSCCRPQPSSSEACGCSVRRSEERRVGKGCART